MVHGLPVKNLCSIVSFSFYLSFTVKIKFQFWRFLRRDLLQHGHDFRSLPVFQSIESNVDNVRYDSVVSGKIKIRFADLADLVRLFFVSRQPSQQLQQRQQLIDGRLGSVGQVAEGSQASRSRLDGVWRPGFVLVNNRYEQTDSQSQVSKPPSLNRNK